VYIEVVVPVEQGDPGGEGDGSVDAARIAAAGRLDALKADLRAAVGI
jgi:phosphomannomutase